MAINDIKLKSCRFSDEDKEEMEEFFREGIYEVEIVSVEIKEHSTNKNIYAEIGLKGKQGQEGTASLWFTDKSKKFSIDTVRKILVHHQETEEKKQLVRDTIAKVDNLFKFQGIMTKMIGCQAWYKVEKNGKTYSDEETGETKDSYNKNIYGFKPTMKSEKAHKKVDDKPIEKVTNVFKDTEVITDNIDLSDVPF